MDNATDSRHTWAHSKPYLMYHDELRPTHLYLEVWLWTKLGILSFFFFFSF